MRSIGRPLLVAAMVAAMSTAGTTADPGRITGVGGVFVKSKDPKALAAWYRDVLGISLEPWGGAVLRYDDPEHPPAAIWGAFPQGSDSFEPSKREFMINFAVDDLDAFLAKLAARRIPILKRQEDSTGRFASIVDPDGTKIELWEPPRRVPGH